MEQREFEQYFRIVKQEPFALYPRPQGVDEADNKFVYVTDNATHLRIKAVNGERTFDVPMKLIEFASPGVVRLTRTMALVSGTFV